MTVTLREDEHGVLLHVLREMLELVTDDGNDEVDDDPLARAVGIGTATEVPDDPALARLFPDAYADDAEASADFRRYTEQGLRERKRAGLQTALDSLGETPHRIELDQDQAYAWLGAINDIRLVLGERLDVSEEIDEVLADLADDDPRLPLFWVYDRLSWLQDTLVEALAHDL